jgi:outer membrane protein assembly factor BamB
VNVDKTFGSRWHAWGVAESPLIVDNKVICTPGGDKTAVVAFDKMTGSLIWQSPSLNDSRSYVSPVIYQYKDSRYILAQTIRYLVAVNPETGEFIWKYLANTNNREASTIPINSPVYRDDEIFICNGYNYPSAMLKVAPDGKSVTLKYQNTTLDNHHDGIVLIDKYVYGSNWASNTQGKWVCMKWDNGEINYVTSWHTKGPIISADGMLYVMEEKRGNFALVKPNPESFEIVSSFVVPGGKGMFWAHPAIYDGKLLIRHGDVLMVYNIRK